LKNARRHFRPSVKSAWAVLLIGLVLLLNAMEACEPLHKLIHHDADKPGHQCVVTLFAHGKVDSVSCDVPVILPVVWIETASPVLFSIPGMVTEILPPGRAPPAVISSQA
jgi:hypothetical protein